MSAAYKDGYHEARVALPAVQAKEPTRRTTVACIDEDHLIHIHPVRDGGMIKAGPMIEASSITPAAGRELRLPNEDMPGPRSQPD